MCTTYFRNAGILLAHRAMEVCGIRSEERAGRPRSRHYCSYYNWLRFAGAALVCLLFMAGASARAQTIDPDKPLPAFKADLHTHYTFNEPIEEDIAQYVKTGYKFLVLSSKDDMKPIKYGKYTSPEMLVIEGVEQAFITRKNLLGHVLGFPIKTAYPFTTSWTLKEGYAKLRAKNKSAILGVCHPHDGRWTVEDVTAAAADGVLLFELNSQNMKHGEFETALWDQALSMGARLYATLTNDVHRFDDIDAYGYIMILAPKLETADILAAIMAGGFYAVESGSAARPERYEMIDGMLEVSAPGAARIRIVGTGGKPLAGFDGPHAFFKTGPDELYVRAEIIDSAGRFIFMQPFFLNPNPAPNAESGLK